MFELGRALSLGNKRLEAIKYYLDAADRGHAGAMNDLGEVFEYGIGVPKNLTTAVVWYERAAELGHAGAMTKLGQLSENGIGVPQDFANARHWYEKAAALGNPASINNLANLLRQDGNLPAAANWYLKAAQLGLAGAMNSIGELSEGGMGVPQDYRAARNWYIAAAAGVRRVALTHHDPSHNDHFVADIERKARTLALQLGTGLDVFCAYEGCELVLEPRSTLKPFVTADPFQASVAQRRFHILVVDDQPDTLSMIVRALEEDHYTVSKATSGPEALRMIDEHMPDLVVLDYKMTGMDGLAVMKTLRTKPETQPLPVLMLTAMTDEPSTRAGFEAGVTDYVTKPFSIPQLTARVRACLARTQLL